MSTTAMRRPLKQSFFGQVFTGAIAGLGGGLVFGMLMAMMGALPMVGALVGQPSNVVGFVVHMFISASIGGSYGLIGARLPADRVTAVIAGAGYGVIWWGLGALILMPLFLGMPQMVFVIGSAQWASLMGHVIYGAITGWLFTVLAGRL